jgi:hypothetical protein
MSTSSSRWRRGVGSGWTVVGAFLSPIVMASAVLAAQHYDVHTLPVPGPEVIVQDINRAGQVWSIRGSSIRIWTHHSATSLSRAPHECHILV